MKKVLSVLLAAAMVAGMSVSSFAADHSWTVGGVKEMLGMVQAPGVFKGHDVDGVGGGQFFDLKMSQPGVFVYDGGVGKADADLFGHQLPDDLDAVDGNFSEKIRKVITKGF